MPNPSAPQQFTRLQSLGIVVFVFLCGFPALEMTGFGFGLPISPSIALASATLGGALGGLMICRRPLLAGLIGGLMAGPIGLLAVYYYTQHRQHVWNWELVAVQGIGSLPGLFVGLF